MTKRLKKCYFIRYCQTFDRIILPTSEKILPNRCRKFFAKNQQFWAARFIKNYYPFLFIKIVRLLHSLSLFSESFLRIEIVAYKCSCEPLSARKPCGAPQFWREPSYDILKSSYQVIRKWIVFMLPPHRYRKAQK